jgi:hypothetical protein
VKEHLLASSKNDKLIEIKSGGKLFLAMDGVQLRSTVQHLVSILKSHEIRQFHPK